MRSLSAATFAPGRDKGGWDGIGQKRELNVHADSCTTMALPSTRLTSGFKVSE